MASTKENAKKLHECQAFFASGGANGKPSLGQVDARGPDGGSGSSTSDSGSAFGASASEAAAAARAATRGVSGSSNSSSESGGSTGGSSSETSSVNGGSGSGSRSSESGSEEHFHSTEESSYFSENRSDFSNISEACKAQLVAFEITYYKAYRQVTRLITEYEVLINSTTCTDQVVEECTEKEADWSLQMETLRQKLEEESTKMVQKKGHITVESKQEKALRVHIQNLASACADMDETISDLDKVRDAIQVFGVCAGLGRPNFHIPVYTGQTISKEYSTVGKTNDEIDADFNSWCANITFNGLTARAAEMSELMQVSVQDMPTHNPVSAPLYGTCPHCNGDPLEADSELHKSGFYRNCWGGEALLDGHTMRTDCGHNSMKAVMCIVDRFDDLNNSTSSWTGGSSIETVDSGSITISR